MEDIAGWLASRIPDEWLEAAPQIAVDRDEIVVVVPVSDVPGSASEAETLAARQARIKRFREETRRQRIGIAREAERRFGRKVAWGVQCGSERVLFTHLSMPVMTRLRFNERQVLDTLVDAGVARSRSHALAWCVRLVARNQSEWIDELRAALVDVERVRAQGPED